MKQNILDRIETYSTIAIYRHEKPDPDALGSQAGLATLLKYNYPNKKIYMLGEEEPSLTFLTKMDNIDTSIFSGEPFLTIVCDTGNTERIDGEDWKEGAELLKIDHHPNVEPYGDIIWVNTEASSTSEMIIDFFLFAKTERNWEMTTEAARLLYAGIVGDTGRFQFSNTTPQTMRLAAEVLEYPIDTTELFTRFYESDEKMVRLKGRVLEEFELTEEGLGIMHLTKELLEEYEITINESSALMNIFSGTKGLQAWVFFVEEDDQYRVRLRSKGPVINEVATNHNGGGHPMASGAKAADETEVKEIIAELKELCRQHT
ncbi:bifunctional oligoribonuclease/PAP phosphatase NrnA [Salibacterium salarium]|uniref:Bifunctional oligoribonuclease/PAP phosphatase NrnA n=1 Tax=Salibacterium salarium TaxID=284579 RepID=A0A428N7B9_9BACI|nr:bifunctional oligoribonuclease/PAP phosphatase NrnA [Salibacterium salarium]RSL34283.1 bifunctional oligoribonuclease/PAP phosphatase NrnA [Salibacterium salarium]